MPRPSYAFRFDTRIISHCATRQIIIWLINNDLNFVDKNKKKYLVKAVCVAVDNRTKYHRNASQKRLCLSHIHNFRFSYGRYAARNVHESWASKYLEGFVHRFIHSTVLPGRRCINSKLDNFVKFNSSKKNYSPSEKPWKPSISLPSDYIP